jgi:two-component system OmpR family sensor kinase
MTSLRRQLLLGVLLPLAGVGLVSACVVYLQARHEAAELLDFQMEQVAGFLADESLAGPAHAGLAPSADPDADADDSLMVRITDRAGRQLYASGDVPQLPPPPASSGFATLPAGDGNTWRVYTLVAPDRVIRVLQQQAERDELGAASALRVLAPIGLLIPVLAAIIWWLIRRALRPLSRLAAAVSARDLDDLQPLSLTQAPAEVMPLLHELNELLARLEVAVHAQRNFVADAAHALRTPLTAIQLQLQLLGAAPDAGERERRGEQLKAGVARGIQLVNQLLSLAREERTLLHAPPQPVAMAPLLQAVAAEHATLAEARGAALTVDAPSGLMVRGEEAGLRLLFANLVDNALRHAPERSAVRLRAHGNGGGVQVQVEDDGTGMAEADLPRAFDRFYRSESSDAAGSGLGLAIVRQIAARHGARVSLRNRDGGGLVATVEFPRA